MPVRRWSFFCRMFAVLFLSAASALVAQRPDEVLPDAPSALLLASAQIPQNGPVRQAPGASSGEKSRHETAAEQLREEEHQRVFGIVPAFNVSYRQDAVSLSTGQKYSLAFHSATDVVTFAGAFVVAGYHEAMGDDRGFGWGAEGYGKRAGAAYLDAFDGNMLSNAVLPALLHQEPRYFRRGQGSFQRRLFYSIATTVICKHDNSTRWEPNYSNIGGNIAAGAISNLYYPSSEAGLGQTFTNGFIVVAEGSLSTIFQEFWPDVSRRLFHRDPTHGLDAQRAAQPRR